jgi:hypothetical protein
MTDALDQFRAAYTALGAPHVEADRSLQVAIRRLVLAGSRNTDSDRLIEPLNLRRSAVHQTREPAKRY